MTTIFLTGGSGHLGRPVLDELVRRGHAVTALARGPRPLPGARVIRGDLARPHDFLHAAASSEAVVHLASPRGNDRRSVLEGDVFPMSELLAAWSRGPFLYGSSQTVYGVPKGPLAESAPLRAECWYDSGKIMNEAQLSAASHRSDRGPGVALRLALVFGAGERRHDRQFLPWVVDACRRGVTFVFDSQEGLETYGSSFIGAEDAGRAVADALAIRDAGPLNVSGGYVTWRALIEAVNALAGTRAGWTVRPGAVPEEGEFRLPQSASRLETAAFAERTGFVPRQDVDALVDAFLAREGLRAPRLWAVGL